MTPIQMAIRTMPKNRRLKKPRVLIFPNTIEYKFKQKLLALVAKMRAAVKSIIIPELPGLVSLSPKRDDFHLDDTVADKVRALMQSVNFSLEDDFSDEELASIMADVSSELSTFNRIQVHSVFKSVLGVDLLSSEPNMDEVISAFVNENVSLIKSVESQYLGEVEQVILRGLRSGVRHEEIARQLVGDSEGDFVSRIGKSESRAELIARDQTNKLYGQLTEIRQRAAGIDSYIWRTALDERVRPEHAEREGEQFQWSDPPEDGNPGEPINCRCYAEPVIDLDAS